MTKTVHLPMLDKTGKLTPLVHEAMKHGATSANVDADTISMTFHKEAEAKSFKQKVDAILNEKSIGTVMEEIDDYGEME